MSLAQLLRRGVLLVAVLLSSSAHAQQPDRRGESVVKDPVIHGKTINAPVPPNMHIRNEGSSVFPYAGLCVISSVLSSGMYQKVPGCELGKQSTLWKVAKSRPGGYDASKLKRLIEEVFPGEKYASYVGNDRRVLADWSARGYPINATMNTGKQYGYRPIHHMVQLVHYQPGGDSCFIDNNDPGRYHITPTTEWDRRWPDGGVGWAWIWTRMPRQTVVVWLTGPILILLAACLFAGGEDNEVPNDVLPDSRSRPVRRRATQRATLAAHYAS